MTFQIKCKTSARSVSAGGDADSRYQQGPLTLTPEYKKKRYFCSRNESTPSNVKKNTSPSSKGYKVQILRNTFNFLPTHRIYCKIYWFSSHIHNTEFLVFIFAYLKSMKCSNCNPSNTVVLSSVCRCRPGKKD